MISLIMIIDQIVVGGGRMMLVVMVEFMIIDQQYLMLSIVSPCMVALDTSVELCSWFISTPSLEHPPYSSIMTTFRACDLYGWHN